MAEIYSINGVLSNNDITSSPFLPVLVVRKTFNDDVDDERYGHVAFHLCIKWDFWSSLYLSKLTKTVIIYLFEFQFTITFLYYRRSVRTGYL